jgi:hypothetical protein
VENDAARCSERSGGRGVLEGGILSFMIRVKSTELLLDTRCKKTSLESPTESKVCPSGETEAGNNREIQSRFQYRNVVARTVIDCNIEIEQAAH